MIFPENDFIYYKISGIAVNSQHLHNAFRFNYARTIRQWGAASRRLKSEAQCEARMICLKYLPLASLVLPPGNTLRFLYKDIHIHQNNK